MTFTIAPIPDEDGAIVAECPAIPRCVSQGRTKTEANRFFAGRPLPRRD